MDPNDTRSWDEAKDLAKQARCSDAELELAAGHIFGENLSVPMYTVITHADGHPIAGALERNSTVIPEGTDPADATDRAVPFEGPRDSDSSTSGGEDERDDDNPEFSPVELDSEDDEPQQRPRKRATTVLDSDSDCDYEPDPQLGF